MSVVLALALGLCALGATVAAAAARSLLALCACLIAAAACATVAMLAMGGGDVAVAAALLGVGLAPFVLLGVLLLSARAVKAGRKRPPWFALGAAFAATVAIMLALPDVGATASAPASAPITPWLAPLVFVAGAAAVALLGFGERSLAAREQR